MTEQSESLAGPAPGTAPATAQATARASLPVPGRQHDHGAVQAGAAGQAPHPGGAVAASLIAARDMSVSLGRKPVLIGVTMHVAPAEIVTVVGPNGSGKSTLLRALLGLVPIQGEVVRAAGLVIGYVPQHLHIDAALPMTVRRFLSLPRRHEAGVIAAMLDRCGVGGLEGRQLADLSGGQFQRVMLARALLTRPRLLILDEATAGLDQQGVAAFYRLIDDVRREQGCGVLMVSHDLHVVMAASDRVICINGHVCCEGTPQVVSNAPEYRALFGLGTGGTLALYRHLHDHDHGGAALRSLGHDGHGHDGHGHDGQGHDGQGLGGHGHGGHVSGAHPHDGHGHGHGHGHVQGHGHGAGRPPGAASGPGAQVTPASGNGPDPDA